MKTKKWLRGFSFVLGVSLILILLNLGNTRTNRISTHPDTIIQLETLDNQLYLLVPEWQINIVGDQKVYKTEIHISPPEAYFGLYLPRAENAELLINQSAANILSGETHLIYLFEPTEIDQTIEIEIRLPVGSNELISAAQLYIGKYETIMGTSHRESNLRLFIVGLSFTIILISASLFFQKPSEKYLIPLALLAYSTMGYILLKAFPSLHDIFWIRFILMGPIKLPFLSMETSALIRSIVFTLFVAYLNYLLLKNFVSVKIFNIDYFYYLVPFTLGIFLFADATQYPIITLLIHIFIYLLASIVIIQGDYTHRPDTTILLIGSIFTMALDIFMAGCGMGILPHGNVDLLFSLGGVSASSFAIAFTIAINGIFARKYAESEILSEELEVLNQNLQTVVDERTSELQTAYERLENEQQQKDVFITNMVHSLKTPLFSITGFADMANEALQSSPEKVQYFIDLINTNADYVVKLVNNLFLALRLEYGQVNYMIENMNLVKMMEQIYNTTLTQIEQNDIQLTLETPDHPLMIECDQNYLTLAIQNIADNAVRHTVNGGKIELVLADLGSEAQISIIDNGEGMEEEVVSRIFERYFSHSNQGNASSGLGLSISKDVITALQGQITVKSVIGKGTEFNIVLPKKNQGVTEILTP